MKRENSDECFIGIFDFQKKERISGKGKFTWTDQNGNLWLCEGN